MLQQEAEVGHRRLLFSFNLTRTRTTPALAAEKGVQVVDVCRDSFLPVSGRGSDRIPLPGEGVLPECDTNIVHQTNVASSSPGLHAYPKIK